MRLSRGQQLSDAGSHGGGSRDLHRGGAGRSAANSAKCRKRWPQAGGSQCGYCTPGFVMSLFAEQYRPGRVGACDPPRWAAICAAAPATGRFAMRRCRLGPAPEGAFRDRLSQPAPPLEPLTYSGGRSRFRTARDRWQNASRLRRQHPEARWIAGATDMGVEVESALPALATPGEPGRRRGAARVCETSDACAHRRGSSAERDRAALARVRRRCFANGCGCSRRRRSAIARRWAEIWRRLRRSAIRRPC